MPVAWAGKKHLIAREGAPARLKGFSRVLDDDNIMVVVLQELNEKVQRVVGVSHVQLKNP